VGTSNQYQLGRVDVDAANSTKLELAYQSARSGDVKYNSNSMRRPTMRARNMKPNGTIEPSFNLR